MRRVIVVISLSVAGIIVSAFAAAQCASGGAPRFGVQSIRVNGYGWASSPFSSAMELGMQQWNAGCGNNGDDFPAFSFSGGPRFVDVYWNSGISPVAGRCGGFNGTTINIYERAVLNGEVVSCGNTEDAIADNVAHELGHALGLDDQYGSNCQARIMGQVTGQDRSVHTDECAQADYLTITPTEQEEGQKDNEPGSPIVLDLDGNGYRLTGLNESVRFDIDADGDLEIMGWTAAGSDDAFLWFDHNQNGLVDTGLELFGTVLAANGFELLSYYDAPSDALVTRGGNGNGWIDPGDQIWPELKVWTDSNHDGISTMNEIRPLTSTSVVGISLDYRETRRHDRFGNLFKLRSTMNFLNDRGSLRHNPVYDIFFVVQ